MMRTSDRGVIAIIGHEGIVPGPYLDTATPPVWTWGVGHTAAAGAPIPADMPRGMPDDLDGTIAQALRVFAADLGRYEAAVRAALTVPVSQHQFDALVSWHYNTGAIARAGLTKRINAGDLVGAAAAFMDWRRPASILERRRAEQRLFRDGIYPDGGLTVWQVSQSGRVIFRPARTLAPAEALTMMGATPAAPRAPGLPVLSRGSTGEHVRLAQTRLVARGYALTIDGDFGSATEAVVRRFQLANLLKVTGCIGPMTWDALNLR